MTAPTDDATHSPAAQDISGALSLLLASGALRRTMGRLDGEDREAARAKRRATALLASERLSEACGGPAIYDAKVSDDDVASDIDAAQQAGVGIPTEWIVSALALLRATAPLGDARHRAITAGLVRSVIRPLCDVQAVAASDVAPAALAKAVSAEAIEDALLALAVEIGDAEDAAPGLGEAAAALTRLVRAGPHHADAAFTAITAGVAARTPRVSVITDGPYLFAGAAELVDHLGVTVPIDGHAALCRCGQSASKPFCDGSHVASGFTGDKDPKRIPDARDVYVGQQATVYDNRGLCAHSGFCTDRLASVFHLGEEPFVTPSGGRLDDIMRAVRRCPSGALGFGLNEVEHAVDDPRPPAIEISKDGPYRITGGIGLFDEADTPVPRNHGASLEHYSLCRCGSSLNKPFCSGMHWSAGFADPVVDPDAEPTLFEWAGGYTALLDMTKIFYGRHVPSDPIVGPLFAAMEADHPERVAAWLSEVFGGPHFYSDRYGGYTRMISQHLDKHLTRDQRAHWAKLMAQSADEAGLPQDPEFRAAFTAYIEWGSRIALENSQANAKPPPNMPVPRWWWVCNATPAARVSALAPEAEQPAEAAAPVLAADEAPSFEAHIKPLFRARDRNSMKFAFDLWAFDDVRKHGAAIHARLHAGTMPCDGAWPSEKVALFERWIAAGSNA